ncbi:MAG: DUF3099 domain-containing protein [Actinocatenispora sp.]
MKRAARRAVLITNAEKSHAEQLRSREIRYALMMGLRVVCLIVGALLAYARVPLWGLWSGLCVAGMVLLPWMAVIIANDRPPRQEHRLSYRMHRHPPAEENEPPAVTGSSDRIIDQDS